MTPIDLMLSNDLGRRWKRSRPPLRTDSLVSASSISWVWKIDDVNASDVDDAEAGTERDAEIDLDDEALFSLLTPKVEGAKAAADEAVSNTAAAEIMENFMMMDRGSVNESYSTRERGV
jgi:hypothetical protein